MKKFIVLTLISCSLIFAFWDNILAVGLRYFITKSISTGLHDANFSIRSLKHTGNGIFTLEDLEIQQNENYAYIPSADISIIFDLHTIELVLGLEIEGLEIECQEKETRKFASKIKELYLKSLEHRNYFPKIKYQAALGHGELNITNNNASLKRISYGGVLQNRPQIAGKIWLSPSNLNSNEIVTIIDEKSDSIDCDITFDHSDIMHITSLLNLCCEKKIPSLKGEMVGGAKISSKSNFIDIESDITITNLENKYLPNNKSLKGDEIKLTINPSRIYSHHDSLGEIIGNLNFKSSVKNLILRDKTEVSHNITLEKALIEHLSNKYELSAAALFIKNGETPLTIKGHCEENFQIEIASSNGGKASVIYDENKIEAKLDLVDLKTIADMQEFLLPKSKKIQTDQGTATLSLTIEELDKQPQITINDINIEDFKGHYFQNKFSFQKLSGSWLNILSKKFSADVIIDFGFLELPLLALPLSGKDISGSLNISQGSLENIILDGSLNNSLCRLQKPPELKWIEYELSGNLKEYIPLIPYEDIRNNLLHHWSEETFNLSGRISPKKDKTFLSESVLKLGEHSIKINNTIAPGRPLEGYISGEGLPLNKFLEPFLKQKTALLFDGDTNLKGNISGSIIDLNYNASNFHLKSSIFDIKVPSIKNGCHSFDIRKKSHHGTVPVLKGVYLEKNNNVTFNDIASTVTFNGKKILVGKISTDSQNINAKGSVLLDFSEKDKNIIDINIQSILGNIKDLRSLCKNFVPHTFWEIPIEGNSITLQNQNQIRLTFSKEKKKVMVEANIEGLCQEANINLPYQPPNKGSFNFKLDNKDKRFEIYNLNAIIDNNSSHTLSIPSIALTYNDDQKYSFDIRMNTENSQAQMKGNALVNKKTIDWFFEDDLSHIGSIFPHIQKFNTDLAFNIIDLKAYPETNLISLPEDISLVLNSISKQNRFTPEKSLHNLLQGILNGKVEYKNNSFIFDIITEKLAIKNIQLGKCELSGAYADGSLNITSLDNDLFQAYSRINFSPQKINFQDCNIKSNDLLNITLNGEYRLYNNTFHADIEEGLVDPSSLFKTDPIRIYGPIILSTNDNTIKIESNLSLDAEALDDIEDVAIKLKLLEYDYKKRGLTNSTISFEIPLKETDRIIDLSEKKVSENILNIIKQLDKELIKGELLLVKDEKQYSWQIDLEPGKYNIAEIEHDLINCSIGKTGSVISLKSKYNHHDAPFWVSGFFNQETSNAEVSISEKQDIKNNPSSQLPLTLFLNISPLTQDISIKKIEGSFSGIKAYAIPMHTTSEKHHFLNSKISLNLDELRFLLPPKLSSFIKEANLKNNFEIIGKCSIPKQNWQGYSFQGALRNNEFSAGKYIIEKLSSQISCTSDKILFNNLTCEDPAGKIYIQEISLEKELLWKVDIPTIKAVNICPANLYHVNHGRKSSKKGLYVKELYIQETHGDLNDPKSWTAYGHLYFENIKKNSPKSLFAIPSDIISRIGLDTKIFSPVAGSIDYEIHDAKVFLTKIRNAYSDNHLSKFYLSKKHNNSYMDFGGNLNIQIRMKQHNLLFKLAELFTITIKGNLKKPRYTLQKQNIIHQEEYESSITQSPQK